MLSRLWLAIGNPTQRQLVSSFGSAQAPVFLACRPSHRESGGGAMSEDTRRATRSEEEGSAQPERFKNRRAGQRTGSTVSRAAARAAQHSDKNLQPAPEGARPRGRALRKRARPVWAGRDREPGRFGVALDRQMRVRDRKPGRSGVALGTRWTESASPRGERVGSHFA